MYGLSIDYKIEVKSQRYAAAGVAMAYDEIRSNHLKSVVSYTF